MSNHSLFIVIEGLDGSGKTTVAKKLTRHLNGIWHRQAKWSYEPNNDFCGGVYIRKVLSKEIKTFSHRTLALAFAANRLDHCDRLINPWLNAKAGRLLVCDRYYLSSLVYQATEGISMKEVMQLNKEARRPDIIFFMNVRNEIVLERMRKRNQAKELFEDNLTQTRDKFLKAIKFLRKERNENIIEIDANGDIPSILKQMTKAIHAYGEYWREGMSKGEGVILKNADKKYP